MNLHPAALALQLEVLGPPEGIIGGANSLVFSKLVENNSRRVDSNECMGTCVRANRCSYAVKGTTLAQMLRGRDTKCFSGSSKAPRKRGSRMRERYSGPNFESHLSARQERRIEKTCVQSASIEPVDRVFPLQDGGNDCSDRDDHSRGLDDQNRSPGRVFLCGDSTRTSKVSKISVGRLSVPVQQTAVRAGVGTEVA